MKARRRHGPRPSGKRPMTTSQPVGTPRPRHPSQLGDASETPTAGAAFSNDLKAAIVAALKVLESAVIALMEGSLDASLRREAFVQAHELAGTLGPAGFVRGVHLAKALEHLLG